MSVGAEYVAKKINIILQLALRLFYHLTFTPSQKS